MGFCDTFPRFHAATCREIRVSTYLRFGAEWRAVFYQARGFFGGRGGIEQSTPRISARSFTVPRVTPHIFPARAPQLRVVITTRRLSVASFAIDHPFLGRNNNNNNNNYQARDILPGARYFTRRAVFLEVAGLCFF
jgi:hypothetical protein